MNAIVHECARLARAANPRLSRSQAYSAALICRAYYGATWRRALINPEVAGELPWIILRVCRAPMQLGHLVLPESRSDLEPLRAAAKRLGAAECRALEGEA